MTRPIRIQYPGAYYHVTSRGNERKEIFRGKGDREQFLAYLKSAYLRYGAVIHVFCLMGNHYHLLIETPKGNLSQIMLHINGAYTNYFNIKHKRRGHLFQGRYKSILVEADAYAGELSRYIHLNPVRAGLVDMPEKYLWSSYQYYIGKKKTPIWLSTHFILGYFEHPASSAEKYYVNFVLAGLSEKNGSPLEKTVASTMLGTDNFIEKITQDFLGVKKKSRDLPALRELKKIENIDLIYEEAKVHLGNNSSVSRNAALFICHEYSGKTLKEIGKYFGISESAVSLASTRFKQKMKWNRKLMKSMKLIINKLNL